MANEQPQQQATTALATTQPHGAVMKSEGFAGATTLAVGETSAVAMAEQAKAAVQSRYLMAMRNPRNWDDVRTRLIKECSRPSFAPTAIYSKPVGDGAVRGFSIRFAEAAMRVMTNLLPETYVVFDDAEKRIIRVMVTDLESNLTYSKDVIIQKVVERKKVSEHQEVLGKRLNTYGKIVYIVRATEDEMLNKVNSAESKVIRNHALRLLPGDILDECKARIEETTTAEHSKDPDAGRKRLVDAFAAVGVRASDLVAYLGHDLDKLQPAELVDLRAMHQALADGEATWDQFVAAKKPEDGAAAKSPAGDRAQKVKDDVAAKVAAKRKDRPAQQKAPEPEPAKAAAPADPSDESVALLQQAYEAASKVVKIFDLNQVLKSAALPIAPYEKWDRDQRVYGIYLLNSITEGGCVPETPDVPFWLGEEESEVWARSYRGGVGKAGLLAPAT